MNRAKVLILLAVCALLFGGCLNASVRDHVADTYERGERRGDQERNAKVYRSSKPPTVVANDIAEARKPADRQNTPSGVYLRYSKDMVAVVPEGRGSRILIEDERTGYTHFYPVVGGWWGTYSGRGEEFRGGGPGGGK